MILSIIEKGQHGVNEDFSCKEEGSILSSPFEFKLVDATQKERTLKFQFMCDPDDSGQKYLIPLTLDEKGLKRGSPATFKDVHFALNMTSFGRKIYIHVNQEGKLGVTSKVDENDHEALTNEVNFDKTPEELKAEHLAAERAEFILRRRTPAQHNNKSNYLEEDKGIDLNQFTKTEEYKDNIENIRYKNQCAYSLIRQMNRLHEGHFIHRDIKPQNILIKIDKIDNGQKIAKCELIDFGSSIFYNLDTKEVVSSGYNFTPGFVAWAYNVNNPKSTQPYSDFRDREKNDGLFNASKKFNPEDTDLTKLPDAEKFSTWMKNNLYNKQDFQYLGTFNDYFQMGVVLLNLFYGDNPRVQSFMESLKMANERGSPVGKLYDGDLFTARNQSSADERDYPIQNIIKILLKPYFSTYTPDSTLHSGSVFSKALNGTKGGKSIAKEIEEFLAKNQNSQNFNPRKQF